MRCVPFVVLLSLVCAAAAHAQTTDSVGVRAQGMAGAFTAVADDATAAWWNPAGLAGGALGNAILEYGWQTQPHSDLDANGAPVPAGRIDTRGLAVAFPALGLSYYRLAVSQIQPPTSTGVPPGVRQDQGTVSVAEQSLIVTQFGATIGQSIGSHLVLGTTLKIVHGTIGDGAQPGNVASLDQAAGLGTADAGTKAGLDLGAMAVFGDIHLGLMVRNANELTFSSGTDSVTLERTARAGFAFETKSRTATIAVDSDLTRSPTPTGDERRLALGGEVWASKRTFGVRGGVSTSTVGARRTALSGGASASLGKKMFVDGEVTGGPSDGPHGWSVDLRVTF
jgi:hypothetical protein